MNYNRGDIVIVPFPFVLSGGQKLRKARPALIISDMTLERRYNDLILASITSQVPDEWQNMFSLHPGNCFPNFHNFHSTNPCFMA